MFVASGKAILERKTYGSSCVAIMMARGKNDGGALYCRLSSPPRVKKVTNNVHYKTEDGACIEC